MAKSFADQGLLLVNDAPTRPATTIHTGDRITIRFRKRTLTVELREVPQKQLSKESARDYYQVIDDVRMDPLE